MSHKQATLALAAFMDSAHAVDLAAPSTPEIRTIARRFLECAWEDMGRPPHELDGEALTELLGRLLPSRFDPADPLAEHVPAVVEAYLAHLEEAAVVAHAFELKLALEPGLAAFAAAARQNSTPRRQSARESKPFVHGAAKTGRNDPCPCGSGRKFKRCHGNAT